MPNNQTIKFVEVYHSQLTSDTLYCLLSSYIFSNHTCVAELQETSRCNAILMCLLRLLIKHTALIKHVHHIKSGCLCPFKPEIICSNFITHALQKKTSKQEKSLSTRLSVQVKYTNTHAGFELRNLVVKY